MAAIREKHSPPRPSSPPKGIIRIVQHDSGANLFNHMNVRGGSFESSTKSPLPGLHGDELDSEPYRNQHNKDERNLFNRQARNENELARAGNEMARARNEISRARNETSRAQAEASREISKAQNEIARARNFDRTGVMKRESSTVSQDTRDVYNAPPVNLLTRNMQNEEHSRRSGRSAKSNINDGEQSEASEGRNSSRRHHQHHYHQHHHNSNHYQRREGGDESRRQHHNGRGQNDPRFGNRLDDSNVPGSSNPIGGGSRSTAGSASTGKLFDPRKDDPVRFAASRKGLGLTPSIDTGPSTMSAASMSDSRSFTSSAAPSTATMSTVSSEGRERRRRRGGPGSRTTTDSGEGASGTGRRKGHGGGDGAMSENNSYVIELKRRYRDVVVLERKLQEEHKLAAEQERKHQAEQQSLKSQMAGGSMARSISSHNQLPNRLGFNPDGSLIHSYWLDLIAKHRTLAEVHVAFMEAALRPGLPASLHSLPQSYKIPTRLWHTAFHSLLERFRQSMPDWQACVAMRETGVPPKDRERLHETIDLFTEYIYFAYSYYTNLLESELFKVFRSSWIENLGDLARYRMAVAKIMSYLGMRDGVRHSAERRDSGSHSRPPNDRASSSETQTLSIDKNKEHNEDEGEQDQDQEHALEVASARMGKDRASIGVAAAQDWDLEEKEIWRSTARGWYAKGLADVPGTGRLHHHLGILSRDDDLRSLYHFCKSLTASHPYTTARESILPLFERSSQTRRISEDASIVDLFVYMHGILFTRIQVDDFDSAFTRFKQLLKNHLRQTESRRATESALLSPSSWMMMATINIAAILQYGAVQEACEVTKVHQNKDKDSKEGSKGTPLDDEEDEADVDEYEANEGGEKEDEENEEDQTIDSKIQPDRQEETCELPCATQKACRLAFDLLDILISHFIDNNKQAANPYTTLLLTFFSQECKSGEYLRKLERYVPWDNLVALGNSIPPSVEPIDPRHDTTLKIRSDAVPLPEDWCLRGMAWIGRRVYERGFWKPHKVERLGLRSSLSLFENELDMIDRCTRCLDNPDSHPDSTLMATNQDGLTIDNQVYDEDDEDDEDEDVGQIDHHSANNTSSHADERSHRPKLTLTILRWKRIVHSLTILIKTVPGMDFDIDFGNVHARRGRLVLAPPLNQKVVDWRAEDTRIEVEQAIGRVNLANLEGRSMSPAEGDKKSVAIYVDADEEDEDGEIKMPMIELGGDSEEVRKLIETRNKLRKQLQDARMVNHLRPSNTKVDSKEGRNHQSSKEDRSKRPLVRLVGGYTTLLLDTNVMLTPTDILSQLVNTRRWMIVIPLPVITELDGLKRREGDVGKRAQDALRFLESRIQSHSTQLKVQTSRGNYLSDLRFRTEDIDFAADNVGGLDQEKNAILNGTQDGKIIGHSSGGGGGGELGDDAKIAMARSVDDVILRCLTWQAGSHFRNRLLLLCPDDEERGKKEAEIAKHFTPPVAKAVLVTLDRNLRIKARFKQLSAIGPSELIEILLQDSKMTNNKNEKI